MESEMALFYECMLQCAQQLLDTADIVREAFLTVSSYGPENKAEQAFNVAEFTQAQTGDEETDV
jgi:uncharacterized metal-binding protein